MCSTKGRAQGKPHSLSDKTQANHTRTWNQNPTAYQTENPAITRGRRTETRQLIRQDPSKSHADAEPKPDSLSDKTPAITLGHQTKTRQLIRQDPSKSHADAETKPECPDFFLHDLYLHVPFSHSCPHMPILFLKKS